MSDNDGELELLAARQVATLEQAMESILASELSNHGPFGIGAPQRPFFCSTKINWLFPFRWRLPMAIHAPTLGQLTPVSSTDDQVVSPRTMTPDGVDELP